jgi:hypothetical protein
MVISGADQYDTWSNLFCGSIKTGTVVIDYEMLTTFEGSDDPMPIFWRDNLILVMGDKAKVSFFNTKAINIGSFQLNQQLKSVQVPKGFSYFSFSSSNEKLIDEKSLPVGVRSFQCRNC